MNITALHDVLAAAGARFGEYRGAETAAEFSRSGTATEFVAMRSGCGIFDLGWRAKLVGTGADRLRWFNGMLTNNIKDLQPNHGKYAFLLNTQGRILGDMYVYNRGDEVLVDTDLSQREKVREIFNKFIIMDDVEISDASDRLMAIGMQGLKSSQVLQAAKISLEPGAIPALEMRDIQWRGKKITGVRVGDEKLSHLELWGDAAAINLLWKALVDAGATPVGANALETWRIACGIPRYGQDIRERDLPQETEQMQALDFRKGCYVGQEIVERIRSRGILHRKFTGFTFSGNAPAAGAPVEFDGKAVGIITSVASVPSSNGVMTIGLGYIRREAGMPGTEVRVDGNPARVAKLPFDSLIDRYGRKEKTA